MDYQRLLPDKKVLITGGSRGLGRVLCRHFAVQGAEVAFTYCHSEILAKETEELILRETGKRCLSYQASAADGERAQEVIEDLKKKRQTVDVLVNNAGVSQFLPLALLEESDWDATLNVNLKGVYIMTRAVLRLMVRQRKGHILNIGSLAGVRILAAPIHYCASKAGIRGFTESLAKEVGRYNIQVNCLAPGVLEGGISRGIPESKHKEFLDQLALRREGTFEEVARLAVFMVSGLNTYMTGNTIVIDGGL